MRELSVAERALVSIASALLRRPRVLILDEPTASLSNQEADRLFDIVRALRDEGVTIIFISHYLDEIFELVDRITVLRDGKLVSTQDISATSRQAVIKEMVGRSLAQLYPKEDIPLGPVMLAIDALSQGDNVSDVTLSVRRGEIFGIAGLVGAGSTELAMALMGALPRGGGSVTLDGKPSAPLSPRAAKAEGFALVPEDRRHEGVLGELTMRENLSLPNIDDFSSFGFLRLGKEKAWAKELIEKLRIAPPKMNQLVRTLSGGNQQKVVIGRWLVGDVKVFLFDEPTTGIDVGSKVEVYHQMTEAARRGAAVIFISSDFDELVGMCDRVAVMYKGKVAAIHERGAFDAPALMTAATGGLGARPETAHDVSRVHATEGMRARSSAFLTRWGTIAGMVLILGVIGVVAPDFLLPSNLLDVLKQGSLLAFVALGLTAVLAAGGFDMSVGAVNQFSANLAAGSIGKGLGVPVALAFGVGAGLVAGLANAALVLIFGMPPFVATVGTMFVAMGLSLLYNRGQALTLSDRPEFFFIGQGHLGPIPFIAVILLAALIVLHVLLRHTRPGLRLSAVGLNLAAASLRGVSRTRAVGLSFVLGGLVIGLSGVVFASYSYGASAVATGLDFLISALAAAFLGTSLTRSGEFDVDRHDDRGAVSRVIVQWARPDGHFQSRLAWHPGNGAHSLDPTERAEDARRRSGHESLRLKRRRMSDIATRPPSATSQRFGEILRSYSALLGMIIVFLIVGYFRPSFLHLANIENVLKQSAILIIMALGLTTVFILRGADLSVAQITDAAGILAVGLLLQGQPTWLAFAAPLALGVALGAVNGLLTAYVGIPAIIGTLGTMFIIRSGEMIYTHGNNPLILFTLPAQVKDGFLFLGQKTIGPVPALIVWRSLSFLRPIS